MRLRGALAVAGVLMLVAGCSAEGIGGITVVTHGSHAVRAGETIPNSVAVAGGAFVVEPGAVVGGDLFVGDGHVTIGGSVGGDVSALGGRVEVASSAHIAGTIRLGVSATLELAAGARLDGGLEEGPLLPETAGAPASPAVELAWAAVRVLGLLLLSELVRRLMQRRVTRAARYLASMPLASLAYGFLVGLVGVSLIVFMVFTLVLLPVAVIGLLALAMAVVLGLAATSDIAITRLGMLRGLALVATGLAVVPILPLVGSALTIALVLAFMGAATLAFQRPGSAGGLRADASHGAG